MLFVIVMVLAGIPLEAYALHLLTSSSLSSSIFSASEML